MSDAFQVGRNTFEKQFAHDENLRFKAVARRNKVVALWVAETKGLSATDAEKYANEFVGAQVGKSDNDVAAALKADLARSANHRIRHRERRQPVGERRFPCQSRQSGTGTTSGSARGSGRSSARGPLRANRT